MEPLVSRRSIHILLMASTSFSTYEEGRIFTFQTFYYREVLVIAASSKREVSEAKSFG